MKYQLLKRGFTLIELLVVIAIIGLLASTVLASLSSTRSLARDSRRLVQAKELMKALEIYRNKNGYYPCSGTAMICVPGGSNYSVRAYFSRPPTGTYQSATPSIEPILRSALYTPADDPFGYSLMYRTRNSGGTSQADSSSYTIVVGLENPISNSVGSTTVIVADGNLDPAGSFTLNYCKITVGTPDTLSVMGAGAGISVTTIGNCPISGIQ